MNIGEAIKIALASLWANKLRSVLTLLGVVIGVAAVIAVVTFVNGINGYVAERVFRLGADVFLIGKQSTVIGVGKKEGKTLGQSRDNYVLIPITAWLRQYGSHTSIRISGKAEGVGPQLDTAIDEATAVLRARRHDLPGKPDSFSVETNASFLSIWANLSGSFFVAMIA